MCKKDLMTIKTGEHSTPARRPCVNLRFEVGHQKANGQADVMLIQALFQYIGASSQRPHRLTGLTSRELPKVNGIFDLQTHNAIKKFQELNRRRLLSADGSIHPAEYEDRTIDKLSGKLMSITLLDTYAAEEGFMRNEHNHISGIIKVAPQLATWLA